ncbi:MAG TPA: hypothetical protein VF629_15965 [Hymenobacter sp.]|jgi:predicted ATPase
MSPPTTPMLLAATPTFNRASLACPAGEAETNLFRAFASVPQQVVLKGGVGPGQLLLSPVQYTQLKQRRLFGLPFQAQQFLELVHRHRARAEEAVLREPLVDDAVGVGAFELEQL